MRAVVAIAIAGCSFPPPADVLPDASESSDAAIDSPIDMPSVSDVEIPLRIPVGDTVDLVFTIDGPASSAIDWSITSGGGVFAPPTGTVATNAGGVGVFHASFTAPATAGDDAHVVALVGGGTTPFTTLVRALMPIGESTAFASSNGQAIVANEFYAQKVHVPAPMIAMKLGFIVDVVGPNARMALYSDTAGAPGALVAQTAQIGVVQNTVEPALSMPVAIAAGDYWIVGNFENPMHVRNDTTRMSSQAFASLAFALPFPAQGSATMVSDAVLNYYLLAAN